MRLVKEVVNLKPDAIFVNSTRLLFSFKQATTTIPIVSAMADPVRVGLVGEHFATGWQHHRGSDRSGDRCFLKSVWSCSSRRRQELPRAWYPAWTHLTNLVAVRTDKVGQEAPKPSIEVMSPFEASYWREEDNRPAFERMVREGVDGIIVTEQNENWVYGRSIVALAKEFKLPAIYPASMFVEVGGLMSFGVVPDDLFRDCARIIAEIFNGANPANIPISQPTKYELGINLKTAKELGIEIPPSLLVQAHEIVE